MLQISCCSVKQPNDSNKRVGIIQQQIAAQDLASMNFFCSWCQLFLRVRSIAAGPLTERLQAGMKASSAAESHQTL